MPVKLWPKSQGHNEKQIWAWNVSQAPLMWTVGKPRRKAKNRPPCEKEGLVGRQ